MALIYIVEDDENIGEIETYALKNAGHEVSLFKKASLFYDALGTKKPDLVILDIMLPDENGYEITKNIRNNKAYINIPIIIISAKTSELDLVNGLEYGADDYIKKPFSVMELISRVKALLRRTVKAEAKQLYLDALIMDIEKREVTINNELINLTYKEFELLEYLLVNKNLVLNREAILEKIWDTDYEGESRTLDMHIKTLRQKLGVEYGSRIKTIRNVGYKIQ